MNERSTGEKDHLIRAEQRERRRRSPQKMLSSQDAEYLFCEGQCQEILEISGKRNEAFLRMLSFRFDRIKTPENLLTSHIFQRNTPGDSGNGTSVLMAARLRVHSELKLVYRPVSREERRQGMAMFDSGVIKRAPN